MTIVRHAVWLAGIALEVRAPAGLAAWAARIVGSLSPRDGSHEAAASAGEAGAGPPGVLLTVHDPREEAVPVVTETDRAALFHYDTFLYPRAAGAWHLARAQGGGAWVDTNGAKVRVWIPPGTPDTAEDWFSVTVMVALALALRHYDRFHVHAALVRATDGRWWGVAGESGAGKTTLTMALLVASGAWSSDDAMFLSASRPAVGWGWPRNFHVSAATLAMFPQFQTAVASPSATLAGKYRVEIGRAQGAEHSVPLAGWLFPQVGAVDATTVSPLSGAGAFGRLLTASAWAAFPELAAHRMHLQALRDAANHGPAWEIVLGRDMLAEPGVAARVVAALPTSP